MRKFAAAVAAGIAAVAAIVVLLVPGGTPPGGGPRGLTQGGGSVDVFVGSTPTPVATPAGETSVGNLWMDQDGGTCTRQGTASAYSSAAACGTIQAAYNAASCGDTIGIKGGTAYGGQTVNATRKDCSSLGNYVTFKPKAGENVVFGGSGVGEGEINMCDGMSWAKFLGIRSGTTSNFTLLDDGTQGSTSGFVFVSGGCGAGLNEWVHHIWVEGLSFEQYLIRGQDNITLKNNNIESGNNASDHYGETNFVTNGYDGSFRDNYTTNLVIDGNDIHEFTSELCAGPDTCHIECLTGEFENITFINNRVWNCGNTAALIFSGDAGFLTKGTANLVANNLIHDNENPALQFGGTESGSVITVVNNTMRRTSGNSVIGSSLGGPLDGSIFFNGNVVEGGQGAACGDFNGSFNYNVLDDNSPGCTTGGTGNTVVDTTFTGAVPDFHLAASQSAQDRIPTGTCYTSTDLDGEARPKGSACDSGADER